MQPATALRTEILRVLRDLQPETMTGEQAAVAVTEFATIEKAAATARMFAAVRVANTDAWRGQGHLTAADWLAAQAGISVTEAAAQLRTAKRADRLPKTKEKMRKGKLSPSQAGAVTDGADADPAAEDSLLDSAEHDTNRNLKEKAAKARAAATDSATRERRIHAERTLRRRTDADGAFCLYLRGPAVNGARLEALLRPYEEAAFRAGRASGARDTYENRSYDAFQDLLNSLYTDSTAPSPTPAAGTGAGTTGGRAGDANASGNSEAGTTGTAQAGTAGQSDAVSDHESDPGATGTQAAHKGGASAAAGSPRGTESTATSRDLGGNGTDAGGRPSRHEPSAHAGVSGESGADASSAGDAGHTGGGGAGGGGGARTAPDPPMSPSAPKKPPGGNNLKVIVRVDHSALARGHTVAGEVCDIAGLGPISVAAAKELMADAFIAAVITKGRDVVNVAHLGRGLNAHQRTAIEWTGTRCSNQACNRTIAIQIDHRVGYAERPETKLDNQDPLCPNCHRLKTHHGWHLEPGTGPRRFLPPEDQAKPTPPPAQASRGARTRSGPQGQRGKPARPTRVEQPTLC